jgi:hypothetical protein
VSLLFQQIEKIKPERLYIFQDGGINDEVIAQLDECLEYAKGLITWPCQVLNYRLDDDIGPAAAEYYAYKWMFSYEEKGIILEDDCIPNESFFQFANTMLERYKDDERISYISGTNPYGVFHDEKDYFFSTRGSLYGWATWRRFIDELDTSYSWLDDPDLENLMCSSCCDRFTYKSIVARAEKLRTKQTPDFEIMICMATVMNRQLSIVPSHNFIMNCGVDASSENGAKSLFLMPKANQKQYYAKQYDVTSFDKCPDEVVEEPGYRKYYASSWLKRKSQLLEQLVRRFLYIFVGSKR